jgi:ribose transport system substrate-binding protein
MRNKYLAASTFFLAILGCRSGPRKVVAAIPIATADSVYVVEHAGLAHEAAANSLAVYWNGPGGEGSVSRQVELAESAIRENDYGIVISPAAPFALNTVIQSAVSHGVPVVVLGTPLGLVPSERLSYVSNDMERTGFLAAQRIAQLVGGKGEVAVVGIDPMVPGTIDCARAFEAALAKLAPRAEVTSRILGSLSWSQSEIAIKRDLNEHPKTKVIYALNLNDIRGATGAVHDEGREGMVKIVGNNQSLDLTFRLRDGTVDALITPDMRSMGKQAIKNLVAAREGRPVQLRTVFEPFMITKENIDTEEMQQMLRLDWRSHP